MDVVALSAYLGSTMAMQSEQYNQDHKYMIGSINVIIQVVNTVEMTRHCYDGLTERET